MSVNNGLDNYSVFTVIVWYYWHHWRTVWWRIIVIKQSSKIILIHCMLLLCLGHTVQNWVRTAEFVKREYIRCSWHYSKSVWCHCTFSKNSKCTVICIQPGGWKNWTVFVFVTVNNFISKWHAAMCYVMYQVVAFFTQTKTVV